MIPRLEIIDAGLYQSDVMTMRNPDHSRPSWHTLMFAFALDGMGNRLYELTARVI